MIFNKSKAPPGLLQKIRYFPIFGWNHQAKLAKNSYFQGIGKNMYFWPVLYF